MDSAPRLLALALCLGAGTIGGVFFAFSAFVMRALTQLPPPAGVAAMQRINIVVLNPLFLGVFLGTTALAVGAAIAACVPWSASRSPLLLASSVLYGVGCFGVTMACNVPRNERLAKLDAGSNGAARYWPQYQREWLLWNHVRTAASLLAAVCAAAASVT